MTQTIQSYPLKLPQQGELRQQLDYLKELTMQAGQQLLERLWSEKWLETLKTRIKKAYKVIGENQVQLDYQGQQLYLPSRIRRCIAEQVGRILRSQAVRHACYTDVLRIVQATGVEGKLDTLVKTVALTLMNFEGKYYRRVLIRQTLRTFRRYYYKLGLDLEVLTRFPYTQIVKPSIWSFILPYTPDDGQVIQLDSDKDNIAVRLKLPRKSYPLNRHDWHWVSLSLPFPSKIYQRVHAPTSTLHLPTLRYITLKGGLSLPFLEFAWSIKSEERLLLRTNRVMATDLGVINLATSVICEAGSQISHPIFWSPNKQLLYRIEQLYHHIVRLEKKLGLYPEDWIGQGKREQERERLYRKLNRYRELILHLASNHLLEAALLWQCQILVLEDLRTYDPPKNKHSLSRKLSNWLRGSIYEVLLYKAKRLGITIKRVSARWTSSYCPRCGTKGQKIRDPHSKTVDPLGRFFLCPHCDYTADRDYIASINIYRMYQEQKHKRFHLKLAKPVSYMGTGIPRNCPRGASVQISMNG
ncbi:MAG: RNA-guided endonuclease TnpB family protein [Promethearchaeota archaeon]